MGTRDRNKSAVRHSAKLEYRDERSTMGSMGSMGGM